MLLIRLEREGRGIFRPVDENIKSHSICQDVYDRHADFPTPYGEGLDVELDNKEWFCGYKSIPNMMLYLKPEEIKFFINNGFKVLAIEATEVQVGDFQVIYTKESITSVTNLTQLFNT